MTTTLTIPLGTDFKTIQPVYDPLDTTGSSPLDLTDWDGAGQLGQTRAATSKASFTITKLTQNGLHVVALVIPRASNTTAIMGTRGFWDVEFTKNRDTGRDDYAVGTRLRPLEGVYTTTPETTTTDPTGTDGVTTTYVLRVEQQSGANFDVPLSTAGETDAHTAADAPKRLENSPAVFPPTGKLVVYQADDTAVSVDYTAA